MRNFCFLFIVILWLCDPAFADDCPARLVTIRGESLSPLLHDGASVMMEPASCAGAVQRGDLVVFRTGARDLPVIKIAKAVPGDRFAVAADGTIRVNGKNAHNSTGGHDCNPIKGIIRAFFPPGRICYWEMAQTA